MNAAKQPPRVMATLQDRGQIGIADVITALERQDGKLAAREQKVANYVKANLTRISNMTIGELAAAAGVSTPTVVRFCRSLGSDGFREFKLRLAQNLAVSMQYFNTDPGDHPTGTETAFDDVLSAFQSAAAMVRHQLDHDQMEAAKLAIVKCRRLVAAGIGGGSSMMAMEFANRLFRLGILTTSVGDSYQAQMQAATLGQEDALIVFSASGEVDAMVAATKIAKSYGAATIAITRPGSRLARIADIPVTFAVPEHPDIFKPTAVRFSLLLVLDALSLAVARERPEVSSEYLRRVRASLTAYHGRTGPLPIGD
ncbi:MAG: MurR/RpiR family transcriptional regulator [Pseudorhodobacter sp.]